MEFVCGENRDQVTILPECVDDYVTDDNPVRVIDAYVENLDMEKLGFTKFKPNDTGRPMYDPKDLQKLYLYGYMNRVRSSRCLEAETKRNLEVIWLLKRLSPDHKTIARFRQQNSKALKNVFRDFVKLCMKLDLYGKELVAIDGSKFKAWNTKDRNFTPGKLEDRIKNIDAKIEAYLNDLNEKDAQEDLSDREKNAEDITRIIHELSERKQFYQSLQDELKNNDEKQISLTDPDSRLMKTKDGLDVCLNIQTAVDGKNNMVVEFEVENQVLDKNLMGPMAERAAEILEVETLTVVADKGYDSASDVAGLARKGFSPQVAGANYDICIPCTAEESETVTTYGEGRTVYIPERNIFICPLGKPLYPSSYSKNKQLAKYCNRKACSHCPHKCTTERGKTAERHIKQADFSKEFDDQELHIRQIKIRADKDIVGQRKCIAEHPFGTVKRALDIGYLLLKGKVKVTGEMSLAYLAFNMKRAINILGTERLLHAIRA
jgi:transposase